MKIASLAAVLLWVTTAGAKEIRTNEVSMANAPGWLEPRKVERVVARVQRVLEWNIRRVRVEWYGDESVFEKSHGYGPLVRAFARKSDQSVHLGPQVTATDFEEVFGHELVHVILFQKYRDAIPPWLEEGLACYLSHSGGVDYAWLKAQPQPDLTRLSHPFSASSPGARYHYVASTALIEMIASKCRLSELLQLSVGKKLESYLPTFCGIKDVNASFKQWINKKR